MALYLHNNLQFAGVYRKEHKHRPTVREIDAMCPDNLACNKPSNSASLVIHQQIARADALSRRL